MYKSIDTLPYKTFLKIIKTGDFSLLSKTDNDAFTENEMQLFEATWQKIYNEYNDLKPNESDKRILNINKEIYFLECKYQHIKMILECLIFDWQQELVDIILGYGFTLNDETYYKDLERISIESESILSNIEMFKSQLPVQKETLKKEPVNIDFVFANWSTIVGIDFDYNLASVTKILGIEMQVQAKIKSLENKK